jgi:hypothetical protein
MRRSARALLPWLSFVALLGAASWVVVLYLAIYHPTAGALLLLFLVAAAFLPSARPELEDRVPLAEAASSGSVASETGAHALDQLG